jgi:1-acyl-sn-glycerol-3-phosphate acyltransferase
VARDDSIASLIDRLEVPFDRLGVDPYGVSKWHLRIAFTGLALLYKNYFRVRVHGIEHVPKRGRTMLVGNHSGGIAIDGAMVLTSMLLEMDPPRLAQAMVDKFINRLPVASIWMNRIGQFTGLPENAERLLHDERMLIVFPEGHLGTAKLYKERYSLVNFGTGFMRLALKTRTPIVPFGFLGGGSAVPSVYNSESLGKLMGVPYVPLTPYGAAVPLPVRLEVHYGEPMTFTGTGDEEDAVIAGHVEQVKNRIARLIETGRRSRSGG